MKDQDRISREVIIANRSYPIKIFKQDEDKINRIVKSVNHKVEQLKSQYDAKDNQDYLAMTILQLYANNNANPDQSNTTSIDFEPELLKIEQLLNSVEI